MSLFLQFPDERVMKAHFERYPPSDKKKALKGDECKIQDAVIKFFSERKLKLFCIEQCVKFITVGQNQTQNIGLSKERLAFVEETLTDSIMRCGKSRSFL